VDEDELLSQGELTAQRGMEAEEEEQAANAASPSPHWDLERPFFSPPTSPGDICPLELPLLRETGGASDELPACFLREFPFLVRISL
jgi:hypothetical protein